jgi:D-aminopeptidase
MATDRPLDARHLTRVDRRAIFALGRAGADYAGGSGDYPIAFCTASGAPPRHDGDLDPIFTATMEATEEAVLKSLLMAETVTGFRSRTAHALPHDRLLEWAIR